MPVLILSRTIRRTAIDLPPMTREFSFGRVTRRMLSIPIELPARDIRERAVGERTSLCRSAAMARGAGFSGLARWPRTQIALAGMPLARSSPPLGRSSILH